MGRTEHFSLKKYNTFGIDVMARYFAVFSGEDQLAGLLEEAKAGAESVFVLGGGSNILLTKDIDGLVLKNELTGIDLVDEDEQYVYVRVRGGGELAWIHPILSGPQLGRRGKSIS
jgi:UDP-N-acetylmuramate dehydrogenase